jgi:hypothetical protein
MLDFCLNGETCQFNGRCPFKRKPKSRAAVRVSAASLSLGKNGASTVFEVGLMPIITAIRLQFEGKLTQEDATFLELRDLDVPKHTKLCGIMIPFF